MVQGLGYALVEEHHLKDGRIFNDQFSTYIIPTPMDTPEIHSILVEQPFEWGPYGAKGLGETPIIAVAPAVTAAIHHAAGVRLREIPATPERVWAALRRAEPSAPKESRRDPPRRCAAAAFAFCALSPARAAEERADVPVIDPRALRAHMRFLSDDLLQGRATGSEGYRIAARYVARSSRPPGWSRPAPTATCSRSSCARPSWTKRSPGCACRCPGWRRRRCGNLDQVLILPSFVRASDEVQGPLVFVGYGITAPGQRHDDYAGVAVAGKVVAVLSGRPGPFPDVLRAHYGSSG